MQCMVLRYAKATSISHLLFVDDSIIFAKATKEEA